MTSSQDASPDPRSPTGRFQAVLSAPTREAAHNALSGMALLTSIFDTPDRWVAAIIAIRRAGMISANEMFFFLEFFCLGVVADVADTDPVFQDVARKFRELEVRHGRPEGEPWPDPPVEFQELTDEWLRREDEIKAVYWRQQGAHEAADLIERSSESFNTAEREGLAEFDRRWPTSRSVM